RAWFERTFAQPTPAQALGWPAIASGEHTLIQAPTGSGKTLAAFLFGIDRLTVQPGEGLRLIYVSPLKALNYDIERNLRGPLAGLQSPLRVAVRTGDTPQKERAAMLRDPPDILITTPESRSSSTCAWSSRSRTCESPAATRSRPTCSEPGAKDRSSRSGRRSIPRSCASSKSIAPRSSSSTTAASRRDSRCG